MLSFGIRVTAAAAVALLATSFALPATAVTASHRTASTSASALKPVADNPAVVHKFTVYVNGTAVAEGCSSATSIAKSKAFPGFIRGRAWVETCAPFAAASCAQTADLQIEDIHTGVWGNDGDGPTKHGCAGTTDASVIQNDCVSTAVLVPYRTVGIFVVIDSQGDKLTWHGDSPTMNVTRVC